MVLFSLQTEANVSTVESTVTEIRDIVADSDRTENNLEIIAGSLEGVANAVSSDIPISEEVTICTNVRSCNIPS